MSRHSSFNPPKGKQAGSRTVLKRTERIEHMKKKGLWGDRKSAHGLPKTRVS